MGIHLHRKGFAQHMPSKKKRALGPFIALFLGAAATPAQAPSAPSSGPLRSPGNANWASNANEARQRAAAQGKFVFIEFDRKGCGPCLRMDTLLYPAFDFEALLIPMVPVKVMIDSDEGKSLALRYGVTDVPAVLIDSPEGRQVFFMQGFTSAPDFYSHVKSEIAEYKAFARRVEAQDVSRISAQEAFNTGKELFARGDSASALPRFQRAIAAPGGTTTLREDARELLAAVQLDGGDPAGSRQTINRLIETTKDKRRRERAELFRAQIPLSENKPEEAYALFLKFEKDHPTSVYLDRVRTLAARIHGQPPKP
jgi:thiol-disulfide isomerase/thioredoxin